MSAIVATSVAHRHRLIRGREWLENRGPSEELLIVGATLDGANELARGIAKDRGVVFGWHRLGISQLAFAIATPALAVRGLAPLSRVGMEAIIARLVHRLRADGRLNRYQAVADAPIAVAEEVVGFFHVALVQTARAFEHAYGLCAIGGPCCRIGRSDVGLVDCRIVPWFRLTTCAARDVDDLGVRIVSPSAS